MVELLSGFRFAVLGGVLAVVAGLGLTVSYYKGKAEKLREEIENLSIKNKELANQIKSMSEQCSRTVQALKESCLDKLKIEREQTQKQLRACKKLLERRKRLEEKLDDIDRL